MRRRDGRRASVEGRRDRRSGMALSGKVTRVPDEDLARAKELEEARLLFLVGAYALITPRGRRLLAEESGESHDDKLPHNG
jgi:hypothetical protein